MNERWEFFEFTVRRGRDAANTLAETLEAESIPLGSERLRSANATYQASYVKALQKSTAGAAAQARQTDGQAGQGQ
jgi:hypothetical protein